MYEQVLVNTLNDRTRAKLKELKEKKNEMEIKKRASQLIAIEEGVVERVKGLKTLAIDELERRLYQENAGKLDVKELAEIMALLRLEAGEPSKITEQKNLNKNVNENTVNLHTEAINGMNKVLMPSFPASTEMLEQDNVNNDSVVTENNVVTGQVV